MSKLKNLGIPQGGSAYSARSSRKASGLAAEDAAAAGGDDLEQPGAAATSAAAGSSGADAGLARRRLNTVTRARIRHGCASLVAAAAATTLIWALLVAAMFFNYDALWEALA